MLAQRFADDLGVGDAVGLGPLGETLLQLGVEPNGLDGRRSGTEGGPSGFASTGDDFVDVVASVRFIGKLFDERIIDRPGRRVGSGAGARGGDGLGTGHGSGVERVLLVQTLTAGGNPTGGEGITGAGAVDQVDPYPGCG